jgi:ankyrin repeat protein
MKKTSRFVVALILLSLPIGVSARAEGENDAYFKAVFAQDSSAALKALAAGADINGTYAFYAGNGSNRRQMSALYAAGAMGLVPVVQKLLDRGVNPASGLYDTSSSVETLPVRMIYAACRARDYRLPAFPPELSTETRYRIFSMLVKKGYDLSANRLSDKPNDSRSWTLTAYDVTECNPAVSRYSFSEYSTVDHLLAGGDSEIVRAVLKGDSKLKVEIFAPDTRGYGGLPGVARGWNLGVAGRNLPALRTLLELGMSPQMMHGEWETADFPAYEDYSELKRSPGSIRIKSFSPLTAVAAVRVDEGGEQEFTMQATELLLGKGAKVGECATTGTYDPSVPRTPIWCPVDVALNAGNWPLAQLLIKKGARLETDQPKGPLMAALIGRHLTRDQVLELIGQLKSTVPAGAAPLMIALGVNIGSPDIDLADRFYSLNPKLEGNSGGVARNYQNCGAAPVECVLWDGEASRAEGWGALAYLFDRGFRPASGTDPYLTALQVSSGRSWLADASARADVFGLFQRNGLKTSGSAAAQLLKGKAEDVPILKQLREAGADLTHEPKLFETYLNQKASESYLLALLELGAPVANPGPKDVGLMHQAIGLGYSAALIGALIQHGVSLDQPDVSGVPPIVGILAKDVANPGERLKALLKFNPNLDFTFASKAGARTMTFFQALILDTRVPELQLLEVLAHVKDPSMLDGAKLNALTYAFNIHLVDLMDRLLDRGVAPILTLDQIRSAGNGYFSIEVTQRLYRRFKEKGLDFAALETSSHASLIGEALMRGASAIWLADLYLELGVKPHEFSPTYPLYELVIRLKEVRWIANLLQFGVDPNLPFSQDKKTPLVRAIETQWIEGVAALLASPLTKPDSVLAGTGQTAIFYAGFQARVADELGGHGADLNFRDPRGFTPLFDAIERAPGETPEVLQFFKVLLTRRADPNATVKYGSLTLTPLQRAIQRKLVKTSLLLCAQGAKDPECQKILGTRDRR